MYYVELKITPALKKYTFPNSRPTSDIQYGYIQEREHTWSNHDDGGDDDVDDDGLMMLVVMITIIMMVR